VLVHGTKNTRNLEFHNIEDINYNDYDNGISVIAVGGNRLARGITLEGLSVSYYLRTTRLYDSLMQMGRWFGFRPGYVDLCRLYTTEQLINWYRHVTLATEEMRADFDEMSALNKQPVDYQLKVRTHPEMIAINRLSITSAYKMRDTERITVSYSGKTIQTYIFEKSKSVVLNNYKSLTSLLLKFTTPDKEETNTLLWRNVNSDLIVDFIASYKQNYFNDNVLCSYIEKQRKDGRLLKWSVAVILNSQNNVSAGGVLNGLPVLKQTFNWAGGSLIGGLPARNFKDNVNTLTVAGGKNSILDKRARMVDLNFQDLNPTEDIIKARRNALETPLLVLYPFDPRISDQLDNECPLVGYGVLFPTFQNEVKVEYAARQIAFDDEDTQVDDDTDSDDE
jgi:Z1 domain.